MIESRRGDENAGAADSRMAAYLEGRHHPQLALPERTAFLAERDGVGVGYIAGHLTRRFGCQGELQYLYVAPPYRRRGTATALLAALAEWFARHDAHRICVDVNADTPEADAFYVARRAEQLRPHWRVWPDIRALLVLICMRRALLATLAVALFAGACFPPPPEGAEPVIVVHGLGRTEASMSVLEYRLEAAGYWVISFDYPSTSEPIETLVQRLDDEVSRCCAGSPETVHFVTHSLGGVIVRSWLAEHSPEHQGRVVMLSPPSQGSELIDFFADSPLLELVVGPAGASLGTDSLGIAKRLGPVHFSLGIITGDRSFNPIASWLIPGDDDGKVSVERARIEGADGFLVVPASHTFIMNREEVGDETIHFLQHGRFSERNE